MKEQNKKNQGGDCPDHMYFSKEFGEIPDKLYVHVKPVVFYNRLMQQSKTVSPLSIGGGKHRDEL
jgi:hypothetical protein